MASVWRASNVRLCVQAIRSTVGACFRKHLLITNTCITVCLGGIGDTLQQKYERVCGRKAKWDSTRTRRICTTSLFIGPTCHYWYLLLDKLLPGNAYKVVAKKVLVDQIVFSPVNIAMFLVILGVLEGMSLKAIINDLKDKGMTLFKAEWMVWPPAQAINFCFIPLRFRVLFDNTVSLGFDVYYSRVKFGQGPEKPVVGDISKETQEELIEKGQWTKTISSFIWSLYRKLEKYKSVHFHSGEKPKETVFWIDRVPVLNCHTCSFTDTVLNYEESCSYFETSTECEQEQVT